MAHALRDISRLYECTWVIFTIICAMAAWHRNLAQKWLWLRKGWETGWELRRETQTNLSSTPGPLPLPCVHKYTHESRCQGTKLTLGSFHLSQRTSLSLSLSLSLFFSLSFFFSLSLSIYLSIYFSLSLPPLSFVLVPQHFSCFPSSPPPVSRTVSLSLSLIPSSSHVHLAWDF